MGPLSPHFEYTVIECWATSIFKLWFNLDLNYTPVKFHDRNLHSFDAIALTTAAPGLIVAFCGRFCCHRCL